MPKEDAERWNARYQQEFFSRRQHARPLLVNHSDILPKSGTGLDIATGAGYNAAFLLQHGLRVMAVDISIQGLRLAKGIWPELGVVLADLTEFSFPDQSFDVILNFYYLQRDLFPKFSRILKPGGLLFFETLTTGMLKIKPDIQAEFLLEHGELKDAFSNWEIISYHEGWENSEHNHQRAAASLIARNPG